MFSLHSTVRVHAFKLFIISNHGDQPLKSFLQEELLPREQDVSVVKFYLNPWARAALFIGQLPIND